MNLRRAFTPLIWHQRILETFVVEANRLRRLMKEINHWRAAEAEGLSADRRIARGHLIEEKEYFKFLSRTVVAQIAQIEKVKFSRKGKVFLHKPVGRMGIG